MNKLISSDGLKVAVAEVVKITQLHLRTSVERHANHFQSSRSDEEVLAGIYDMIRGTFSAPLNLLPT